MEDEHSLLRSVVPGELQLTTLCSRALDWLEGQQGFASCCTGLATFMAGWACGVAVTLVWVVRGHEKFRGGDVEAYASFERAPYVEVSPASAARSGSRMGTCGPGRRGIALE